MPCSSRRMAHSGPTPARRSSATTGNDSMLSGLAACRPARRLRGRRARPCGGGGSRLVRKSGGRRFLLRASLSVGAGVGRCIHARGSAVWFATLVWVRAAALRGRAGKVTVFGPAEGLPDVWDAIGITRWLRVGSQPEQTLPQAAWCGSTGPGKAGHSVQYLLGRPDKAETDP